MGGKNSVFIPFPLHHFASGLCSFLSSGVVFSGYSKLEGGPGLSAPSESSVSDDTASFHTAPGRESSGREGELPLHTSRGGVRREKAGLLQQSVQVMMQEMSLDPTCHRSRWCFPNHQRLMGNECGSVASGSLCRLNRAASGSPSAADPSPAHPGIL